MTRRRVHPGAVAGRVEAPSSKSYTHRALLVGAIVGESYRVESPLDSDDTVATAQGLEALGVPVVRSARNWRIREGISGSARPKATVDCRESGTTLRFLLPRAALRTSSTTFRGRRALAGRPIEPLLAVLRTGGVAVERRSSRGELARIRGPLRPVRTPLDASASSQFLSGLLLTLPALEARSDLQLVGASVSRPYVAATLAVLAAHGVSVRIVGRQIRVPAPQVFVGTSFRVPPDASSAAVLWSAAAAGGGQVTIGRIDRRWPQADWKILEVLRRMGASVAERGNEVTVSGLVRRPIRVDLTDAPDLLPLVGVLASVVPGRSVIRGAAHAAAKETDRRQETGTLARAMGARVQLGTERIEIVGRPPVRAFRYEGAGDHRMVMAAAVGALAGNRPSSLGSAEAVTKSFPRFWDVLSSLGAQAEVTR
ncbi:MAG: 3-phosphoshikimate 1-carboxyvinyltransferase [Thermoplasmata archaeon]|nr:3-phosphoshikimate 1-carboxyvinyltransferase [Thermoplasmata archaeon]MCI4356000.1 3-phosphoshikimate 1-carboxyvinyltransferase [Thermoplasmata archaeon]